MVLVEYRFDANFYQETTHRFVLAVFARDKIHQNKETCHSLLAEIDLSLTTKTRSSLIWISLGN